MKIRARGSLLWALLFLVAWPVSAAELVSLTPQTWDEYAPHGKEADCIYGDYVLRNDQLVAVIANPIAGRNANMLVWEVGGGIIDLTRVGQQSDQLTVYFPGESSAFPHPALRLDMARRERPYALRYAGVGARAPRLYQASDPQRVRIRAESVHFDVEAEATEDKPAITVRYTLEDGWPYVQVETVYSNPGPEPIEVELTDAVLADAFGIGLARGHDDALFDKAPDGKAALFWAYDKWFGQAYGLVCEGHEIESASDSYQRNSTLRYVTGGHDRVRLQPSESYRLVRRIFPGANLLDVKAIANSLAGVEQTGVTFEVKDTAGSVVADADVTVAAGGEHYGQGRTGPDGTLRFELPAGEYKATVSALGRGSKALEFEAKPDGNQNATDAAIRHAIRLQEPGYVMAQITDAKGRPIPCKVQFRGKDGTGDPFFGPDSGEHGVHNLYYSQNGRFRQVMPPGKYDVIISHGPEYDAIFTEIEVVHGRETPLEGTLVRSVQTPGWISSDFHSHSSPSGDNPASQLGRVLNLLSEHIEFAPSTEHNRLSTYVPHLKRLGVEALMATCTGMELSGKPGMVNHHNAFPLVRKPHTQDNGAPLIDDDPEVQFERLALWDDGSEKLVQQSHPDIGELFFDKDGDGTPDGGFAKMFGYMDVIEVHVSDNRPDGGGIAGAGPYHLRFPEYKKGAAPGYNAIFDWLQLLNQGYRIPGVVNTDSHYNFHGSGFLRNYLKSPTDDPAQIQTLDMVHAAEGGNIIMTNGPYLEVLLRAETPGVHSQGTAGDNVVAPDGKATLDVRVQCPNWFDIDRVQVFLNGRATEALNFTRQSTPDRFSNAVVKFDEEIPLKLTEDTHVIVAAVGEHSKLGLVMGPEHGNSLPIAVSNPIFVDVDGGGFQANRDTLGVPPPVKGGRPGRKD